MTASAISRGAAIDIDGFIIPIFYLKPAVGN
jgi:hypothetical protein